MTPETMPRSELSELLDKFEKLSPEERRRDIENANAFLRDHGIDGLRRLDQK
jgi:hypothetical protein